MASLELLLLRFGNRGPGPWAIDAMQRVKLHEGDAPVASLFPVHDDLVAMQPARIGTKRFLLGQSIVPIVAQVHGESKLRCLGTGFFISCSGLLVTAAHVITDPIERQYGSVTEAGDLVWHARALSLGVMLPLNPVLQGSGYVFRPIEWASFLAHRTDSPLPISGVDLKITSDTAICQVAPLAPGVPHQPLAIVQPGLKGVGMATGKAVTAVGYGAMRDVDLVREAGNTVAGDFSFDLHASTGQVLQHFPRNFIDREVPTPGPCFSASIQLPSGMSGSPMFDDEGVYVHGVVSKGWNDETGLAHFGFGSMLGLSFDVPIRPLDGKSLRELHAGDEHGMPKLRGPDM